jgi:hypothetical protein
MKSSGFVLSFISRVFVLVVVGSGGPIRCHPQKRVQGVGHFPRPRVWGRFVPCASWWFDPRGSSQDLGPSKTHPASFSREGRVFQNAVETRPSRGKRSLCRRAGRHPQGAQCGKGHDRPRRGRPAGRPHGGARRPSPVERERGRRARGWGARTPAERDSGGATLQKNGGMYRGAVMPAICSLPFTSRRVPGGGGGPAERVAPETVLTGNRHFQRAGPPADEPRRTGMVAAFNRPARPAPRSPSW